MAEYKGKPLVLAVTAADIPSNYTHKHQDKGICLWLCDQCHFHNWEWRDKCERCGDER